jgi:hypothetical protein
MKENGLKLGAVMTDQEKLAHQNSILQGVQQAIDQALDRHRRLGQSIAIMRDNQIIILQPEEIEALSTDRGADIET